MSDNPQGNCPQDSCPTGPPNSAAVEAQFPTGNDPHIRSCNLSALCSYGVTPLVMQGALRQILIQHYADTRNILNATLQKKFGRDGVWRPGTDTGIMIESLHRWRPELTEARPGLILKEGAWQWQRLGIGDQAGGHELDGRRYFGGYWQGSHTIFALANEGAEAQILAIETMKSLLMFEQEILVQLELQRFVPVSIGEVSALAESSENYVVPIVVAYVVPEWWEIIPDAPRLKQVVFKASETLKSY